MADSLRQVLCFQVGRDRRHSSFDPDKRLRNRTNDSVLKYLIRSPPGNRNTFSQASPAIHSVKGTRLAQNQRMSTFGQTFHCLLCDCVGSGSVVADMSKTYSDWLGRQVVLQIKAGESLVPLRGLVVHESNNALRFRLDGCWEVDIYKEMILQWKRTIMKLSSCVTGKPTPKLQARRALTQCRCSVGIVFSTAGGPNIFRGNCGGRPSSPQDWLEVSCLFWPCT